MTEASLKIAAFVEHRKNTGDMFLRAMALEPSSIEQVHGPSSGVTLPNFQYTKIYGFLSSAHHPNKNDSARQRPPFGASLRANHIIINNADASQIRIGWNNLLKGRISKEWSKLWDKAMGPQLSTTCELTIINALCNHSYRL
jgi:hypothetical protein